MRYLNPLCGKSAQGSRLRVLGKGIGKKYGVMLLVAMLSLLAEVPLVEAFGFSVEPARVELSIPAGKRRGKSVTVNNAKSDQSLHIKIYVSDVVYLPD